MLIVVTLPFSLFVCFKVQINKKGMERNSWNSCEEAAKLETCGFMCGKRSGARISKLSRIPRVYLVTKSKGLSALSTKGPFLSLKGTQWGYTMYFRKSTKSIFSRIICAKLRKEENQDIRWKLFFLACGCSVANVAFPRPSFGPQTH